MLRVSISFSLHLCFLQSAARLPLTHVSLNRALSVYLCVCFLSLSNAMHVGFSRQNVKESDQRHARSSGRPRGDNSNCQEQ